MRISGWSSDVCSSDLMVMTGKRHPFEVSYEAGFDDDGHLLALSLFLSSNCGATVALSPAINDRAMFHADSCYYLSAVELVSERLQTTTVSATAFRGLRGPPGMLAIERLIDHPAAAPGKVPQSVRHAPLSRPGRGG